MRYLCHVHFILQIAIHRQAYVALNLGSSGKKWYQITTYRLILNAKLHFLT